MIDFATDATYPYVQEIWRDCFGDNREYTDFLFSRLIGPEQVLTWNDEQGKPVAMLCFHPCVLRAEQESYRGIYIFGVATLPAWRKRGISTLLLTEMQKRAFQNGFVVSVLVPGGESLFRFYAERGYRTVFHVQKRVYSRDEFPSHKRECRFSPLSLDEWIAMRDRYYRGSSFYLSWDKHYLNYIASETQALGGDLFGISCGHHHGFAVCYPYKEKLIVKELAMDADCIDDVVASLHDRFDRQEYRIHLPSDTKPALPEKATPFAMLKWHDPELEKHAVLRGDTAPYIAHVLDGPTLGVPLNIGEVD